MSDTQIPTTESYEAAGLSPKQAEIQQLRDGGYTQKEIAEHFDTTEGNISKQCSRIDDKVSDARALLELLLPECNECGGLVWRNSETPQAGRGGICQSCTDSLVADSLTNTSSDRDTESAGPPDVDPENYTQVDCSSCGTSVTVETSEADGDVECGPCSEGSSMTEESHAAFEEPEEGL
jgi:formylmethanofuran dehydrogenase subunit E